VALVLLVVYLVSRPPVPDDPIIPRSNPDSADAAQPVVAVAPETAKQVPTAAPGNKVPTAAPADKEPTAVPAEKVSTAEANGEAPVGSARDDVASLYAGAGQAPLAGRVPPSLDAEQTTGDVREVSPAPEEPVLDVDAIAEAARLELVTPAYEESDIPLVNQLNQRTRDEIPSLFFTAHTWSPSTSGSVVTLNGKLSQEGDNVAAGVTLVTIGENSIVLDFQGTRFRLRSLNSWVNL
jgi:hypothetical protein